MYRFKLQLMLPNSILSTHEVHLLWARDRLTLFIVLTVHIHWSFVEAGEPVVHQTLSLSISFI